MEASFTQGSVRAARQPLAGFGKVTAGALVVVAALIGYLQVLFGGFDPMMTGISALALVFAAVVAIGWRWAPLLGTLVCGALLALLGVVAAGEVAFTLAHPGSAMFAVFVVAIPTLLIGFVASIVAVVQNYRGASRRAPAWLAPALLLVAGLAVGAAVVGGIPRAGDAGISQETLAALPGVTLDKYEGGEVRVKAGETAALRLENPDGVAHTFTVDELGVDALMPAGKNSLALFKPTKPGTYTFYCVPHYDKATGQGMHGTLVVE